MELEESDIIETMQWTVDNILIPHFMALGLNATGQWVDSIKVRADGNDGIISGVEYTEQLVYGRKPGAMPPISPLIQWAQIKLGLSGNQAVSAAWAIAKKIQKEGTDIYQDGGTTLIEVLETEQTQRLISAHLQDRYAIQVKNYLEREITKAWQ